MIMEEKDKTPMSHEVCTGCSCCLLSCPVWNRTRDRSLTAQGRNRALQAGAAVEDIARAIDACLLCGTCAQNCPEGNDIVGLTIEHRRLLNRGRKDFPSWYPKTALKPAKDFDAPYKGVVLLAGGLKDDKGLCEAALRHLGDKTVLASDDGSDILQSIEAGLHVDKSIIDEFVYPLKHAAQIIAAEGGFLRHLREWLPGKKISGLGAALMAKKSIRRSLCERDLYVIDSRAYHHDYARLVRFYDTARRETGAQFNLDLQRAAIPTGASALQAAEGFEAAGCIEQAKWILHAKKVERIIVENAADMKAFKAITDIPVVHVAQLT